MRTKKVSGFLGLCVSISVSVSDFPVFEHKALDNKHK